MLYNTSRDAFSDKTGRSDRKIQEILLFGRYLILSELGRGSGSKVYLARHQTLGEYRAIKQISKKSDFAWKVREARILNRLNHPKVPKLYDMEEDEEKLNTRGHVMTEDAADDRNGEDLGNSCSGSD